MGPKSHKSLLLMDMDGVCNRGSDNCSPNRHIYNDRFSWVQTLGNGKSCEMTYVDPEIAKRLSKLITDFDMYIVASTTWRYYYSMEDFKELLTLRGLPGERLIGYTPSFAWQKGEPRSAEIKYFLEHFDQPVEKYIILDDLEEARFDTDKGRLFKTDYNRGYDEEIDKAVREYLKGGK